MAPSLALPLASLLAATTALTLRIPPPASGACARVSSHAVMVDDGCEMVNLEGHASAQFGRHYRMDAWVCPEDEALHAQGQLECLRVEHLGKLVWACDPLSQKFGEAKGGELHADPVAAKSEAHVAAESDSHVAAENDALVDLINAVLPKLKLSNPFRQFLNMD
ncbi:hypothetical protein AB1Y20_002864 [Prymnesium parvum]|uniref:Uncharacterized protein n=1 Tax=Prymnesium parvum TaxID=97485 RepID=A0AB34JAK8_PRYPA